MFWINVLPAAVVNMQVSQRTPQAELAGENWQNEWGR